MHKSIIMKAAGIAYPVFFTLIDEKYTVITYIIVSDDAISTEAQPEAKLSTPYFSNISASTALEPLPDIGRSIIRGISSTGTPILFPNGSRYPERSSTKPDAETIETPTISITKVGRSERESSIPLFIPRKNSEVASFFIKRSKNADTRITKGTAI